MFERYTEKARRVIFFSRYEASQLGSLAIGPEHMLLGLLREDTLLVQRLFSSSRSAVESIRKEIEECIEPGTKLADSVDMPLSPGAKRAIEIAADESEKRKDLYIGTTHLLIGIIKERNSIASRILAERGISAEKVIAQIDEDETPHQPAEAQPSLQESFYALLDLLVKKEVISEDDRRDITKTDT